MLGQAGPGFKELKPNLEAEVKLELQEPKLDVVDVELEVKVAMELGKLQPELGVEYEGAYTWSWRN